MTSKKPSLKSASATASAVSRIVRAAGLPMALVTRKRRNAGLWIKRSGYLHVGISWFAMAGSHYGTQEIEQFLKEAREIIALAGYPIDKNDFIECEDR